MSKYKSYYKDVNEETSIENLLPKDEQILWRGKPNKFAMIMNSLLTPMTIVGIFWLCVGVFLLNTFIDSDLSFGSVIYVLMFFMIPVIVCLGDFVATVQSLKNIEYVVTNRRILIRTGFLGIDLQSIFYKEIKSVSLNKGILDYMLGVADIYIETKNSNSAFFDLNNAYEIYNRLQKIVLDIQADMEFPNAYRPDYNPGYNTKYEENEEK